MSISAVITNYNPNEQKLFDCFLSLQGKVLETILISSKNSSLGEKINMGFRVSKGDYILILNDDAVYENGNLEDLCVPGSITCPKINGIPISFHAHAFCVPREIYEATGGYDESYEQAYYDDWDFWRMVESKGFDKKVISTVNFTHPPVGATTLSTIAGINDIRERNRIKYFKKWGAEAKFGA
jgi:GT2 family glycosyltransferase